MDKWLPQLYREYGLYSNYRNFPLDLDGLKPVERRVLLSAYKIARDKLVKSRQVDAYTIGHFHPHGECIHGNTRIKLLDGRAVPIKELIGVPSFWVYSCKPDGEIVPGLAHSVKMTKRVKKYLKITFDNFQTLECTDDHPIMMRIGSYKHAKDLKIGDSLMPLHTRMEDGYMFYSDNSKKIKRQEKVCKMVIRNMINKNIDKLNGMGKAKYHTHHINNIRNDDRPENLMFLPHTEHTKITASERPESSNKIISEKVKKAFIENKEFRKSALNSLEKGRRTMFSEGSPIREKIRAKNSKLISDHNKKHVKLRILKLLKDMSDKNILINESNYNNYKSSLSMYNPPKWKTIFEKFNCLDDAIEESKTYNHKVTMIETIHCVIPIEVYDLSVEKYHNFAIDSGIFIHNCYGTIVQLVRQGFLDGQGNFGTTYGVEPIGPAAPRYTECKISKKTIDLAFKYVNYVEWHDTELNDTEPVFLPTKYPLCLLGKDYTQGIGFGFKTYVPCYAEEDLKRRLMWLLKIKKTRPIIAPITDCDMLSSEKDLDELLKNGKARIEVRGKIVPHPSQNKVVLKSWPPGKRFESILNKFSDELESGMIGFTDMSVTSTEIVFEVLRERNREKIYTEFLEKLKEAVTGAIPFETIVSDIEGNVNVKSIDQMLLDTFNMFLGVNKNFVKENIKQIEAVIAEYKLLEKIKPYLISSITSGLTVKQTIEVIDELAQVPKEVTSGLINKYKISKLLELKTDTKELEDGLKIEKENLKNIDERTINQY